MNTSIFIDKSNIKHKNYYKYDKTIYVSNKTFVTITCPQHGDFYQTPNNHLSGYGCSLCAINRRSNKRKMSDFVDRSRSKFGDKFNYTDVNYINNSTNIKLTCVSHGEFLVLPSVHLSSNTGCSKCSSENTSKILKLDTEDLLLRFNKIHGNRYDYSKVEYQSCNKKVEIICSKHGSFLQSSKQHLRGQGCPNCNISIGEFIISEYLKSRSIKYYTQHTFNDCKYKHRLRFDFYLPDINTIIEFDGIQHFEPVGIFGGNKSLKSQIDRDVIKNKYCLDNSINLIRVKYDDCIEKKLNQKLNEI